MGSDRSVSRRVPARDTASRRTLEGAMRLLLAVTALSAALGGCRNDYVRVNDMALGRVVIYRNGVAYYERRATLSKDSLTIQVPRDKVNDFLKSLTVRDARTGRTLPVGFPSPGAEYGGLVNMV